MLKFCTKILSLFIFILGITQGAYAIPNIINGSFEADSFSYNGTLGLGFRRLTGWTTYTNGIYPWGLPNINYYKAGPTPYGNQWVVVGDYGQGGTWIQQTVGGFVVGQAYTINFSLASELIANQGALLKVSFPSGSGTSSQIFEAPKGHYWENWASFSMDFVANSPSVTIRLTGLKGPGYDAGIDNVFISSTKSVDLSISDISMSQPINTPAPKDANGNSIIATTTPPNANPAPATQPVQAQALVTVKVSGTPSGTTATNIQLKLGDQILAEQVVDIGKLQNPIAINFTPPTDPSLLGVLPLTATINAAHDIQETDYSNNSFTTNVNTMVLCKVEDSGRSVKFKSQTDPQWANLVFGIKANSSVSNPTMQNFGCSVTDLYMLFDSYGIRNVPLGSPANPLDFLTSGLNGASLDPGSLNLAMANYRTSFLSKGSVGFNGVNDPIWSGAVEVARAGYRAQCSLEASGCNPDDALSKVSFKHSIPAFANEQAAITGIQNQICNGNPVILKFGKANGGQHFMLATGIVWDNKNNMQTLKLNNTGTNLMNIDGTYKGQGQLYSQISNQYISFIGGELFRPAADPTMMYLTASLNVHFVITDPLGRRTGYDPISSTTYSEIPGATYEIQSIDTPNEIGFTPETLVAERYFISSSDVQVGEYQVQVFSVGSGSYYLDYRGFDATGTTNKSIVHSGTIQVGQSETVSFLHSDQAMPVPNAKISLKEYAIHNIDPMGSSESNVHLAGKITPNVKTSINMDSDFVLMLGGIGEFKLDIPAASFKMKREDKEVTYEYHNKDVEIKIESDGNFQIELRHADLSNVNKDEISLATINIGSIIGQVNSIVTCNKNECSLKRDKDDNRHDNNKEKER